MIQLVSFNNQNVCAVVPNTPANVSVMVHQLVSLCTGNLHLCLFGNYENDPTNLSFRLKDMAWIIAGIFGLGGAVYIGDQLSTAFNEAVVDPINRYIDIEKSDALQREFEFKRQERIAEAKARLTNSDNMRRHWKLNERRCYKIVNDTDHDIWIVYVNHYFGMNQKEAIEWAKKCLENDMFDGQWHNKKCTKVISIASNEAMKLISTELCDYTIVVVNGDRYKCVDTDNLEREMIIK